MIDLAAFSILSQLTGSGRAHAFPAVMRPFTRQFGGSAHTKRNSGSQRAQAPRKGKYVNENIPSPGGRRGAGARGRAAHRSWRTRLGAERPRRHDTWRFELALQEQNARATCRRKGGLPVAVAAMAEKAPPQAKPPSHIQRASIGVGHSFLHHLRQCRGREDGAQILDIAGDASGGDHPTPNSVERIASAESAAWSRSSSLVIRPCAIKYDRRAI